MIFAIASIALNAIAQIFMKKTALHGIKPIQLLSNTSSYIALFCYGLSVILWLVALKEIKLSVAYPMQSVGYILVTIFSYFMLSEKIGIGNVIGLTLILLGAVTLGLAA